MDPALVSSTSHGVDSASLRLDPSQIRIQRGFLWKKAADTKKWKKRFFLLKTDLRNATDSFELYYYAKENDQTPKAIIVLDGAEVMAEARNKHDKSVKYEFQLHVAGGQVVELYCDDPNVRKDWVDTLAAVVNAHRKRMQVSPPSRNKPLKTSRRYICESTLPFVHARVHVYGAHTYTLLAGVGRHVARGRRRHGRPVQHRRDRQPSPVLPSLRSRLWWCV